MTRKHAFNRRTALLGGAAALGTSLLTGARPAAVGTWGRIANSTHRGQRIYTGLFFAGPHNPNSVPLFTRHPLDPDRLDWTSVADIRFALQRLVDTGLNTITLSYFGHEGDTDAFAPTWLFSRTRWSHEVGVDPYTEAEQVARVRQLFAVAREMGLLIAPLLEVTPNNRFFEYFPANLDVLLDRAGWLLKNFGDEPNFLRVYDQNGKTRHVLSQIEAIHVGPVDTRTFASGFDKAAERLYERTGHLAGWWLDVTPLPPFGSHDGPDPAALRTAESVVGINPFNITSQSPGAPEPENQITPDERMAYARVITEKWAHTGIPYLAPLLPGYDAGLVFPHLGAYGFTADWLRQQQDLAVRNGNAGLCFNTLNGFTEGYNIYPTEENGDTITRWARESVTAHRNFWI